jgi:hypothetical protein
MSDKGEPERKVIDSNPEGDFGTRLVLDYARTRKYLDEIGVIWTEPNEGVFKVEGYTSYWLYPKSRKWRVAFKSKYYRYKNLKDWFERYYEPHPDPDVPLVVTGPDYSRAWLNNTWVKCEGPITLNDIERMRVLNAVEGKP